VRSINRRADRCEVWSSTFEVVKYIGNNVDLAFEFDLAETMSRRRSVAMGPVENRQERVIDLYRSASMPPS